jgi:phospholipid transport system substrate-binding protein
MWTPRRSPELCLAGALVAMALAALSPAPAAQSQPAAPPAAAAAQPKQSAREFVTTALDAITAALKDRTQPSHARRLKIQDLVNRWLDAETISKLALAKHWKDFNPDQQKTFVDEFHSHLVLTYYRNVDRYKFDRIDIYEARDEKSKSGDWTVRTKVIAPGQDDVLIDLRVRPTPDGSDWKVIDILIEGVSLVQNFRSQFQDLLSDGSPDKLLVSLRDKNDATLKQYEDSEAKEDAAKGGGSKG